MSASSLLIFALALAAAAGSPGPSIAALVTRVVNRGIGDVLPFLLAMWLGEVLWITAAVTGLGALARTFGTVFVLVRYAGVVCLLVMAWAMWRAPTDAAPGSIPAGRRPWRMFATGLMVTLGNPKILAFYVALLPTFVDLDRVGVLGWSELCATAVLVLCAVDVAWALAAARARLLLKTRKAVRIANRTGASMMAGAAIAIATRHP